MLLPSALSCDTSQTLAPRSRLSASLFASPPMTPSHSTPGTIFATCRALQSMLSSPQQLPTPPMTNERLPGPFKLRLRSRKVSSSSSSSSSDDENESQKPRKKIAKRIVPPKRINKRRRDIDDDGASDADEEPDTVEEPPAPSTPKRIRLLPTALPLGLHRADFQTLDREALTPEPTDKLAMPFNAEGLGAPFCEEPEWTNEEDRLLVELVLEKLKLSKNDWQDCARSLGKDRGSVGKRWRSLVGGGEVGFKGKMRREKIYATWR